MYLSLLALGHILAMPFLGLFSLKDKYKHSLKARFLAKGHALDFKPSLWFHACSFGEIKSLERLLQHFTTTPILLTTTTQTGYDLACKIASNYPKMQVRFLLFETLLYLWQKDLTGLKALVVTEAELWYSVFGLARKVGAKTFLINARISSHSYKRYQQFKWFYAQLFKQVDYIYAQSLTDKKRLKSLGALHISIFPNLKIFNLPRLSKHYTKPQSTLFLAASTHPSEEALILKAFLALKDMHSKLLIAPRHPERFKEVKTLLEHTTGFTSLSSGLNWNERIVLLDVLGVLNDFYALADVVILGGSFVPLGGHNPIEPAFFKTKLITGPYIFNQEALFAYVQNYTKIEAKDLASTLATHVRLKPSYINTQNHSLEELVEEIHA